MIAYEKEELDKKEKRLLSLYEQWKANARKTSEELKARHYRSRYVNTCRFSREGKGRSYETILK